MLTGILLPWISTCMLYKLDINYILNNFRNVGQIIDWEKVFEYLMVQEKFL